MKRDRQTGMKNKKKRILAVSSAGGHWVQLQRMRTAWVGCDVTYMTTKEEYRSHIMSDAMSRGEETPRFYCIQAATRWQKHLLVLQLIQIIWVLIKERPQIVISTGAAAGYFALRIGKILGARTIWVDSVANAEELSLSGSKVGKYADLWLTQWPHLANGESATKSPSYAGAVL